MRRFFGVRLLVLVLGGKAPALLAFQSDGGDGGAFFGHAVTATMHCFKWV